MEIKSTKRIKERKIMVKITLWSEGEITSVLEGTKELALKKLESLLVMEGYQVSYNMDSHIKITNKEYGEQRLSYLCLDNTKDGVDFKDDDIEHIDEPVVKQKRLTFTAVIQQRSTEEGKYSYTRLLLREVRLGKLLFREHMWIEESTKLKNIPNGTVIEFRAKVEDYANIDDSSSPKQKFISLRGIKIIDKFKGKIHLNLDQYKEKNYARKSS